MDAMPSPISRYSAIGVLEEKLEEVCRQAQREVELQPPRTQRQLTVETQQLFAKYKRNSTGRALGGLIGRYFNDASHGQEDCFFVPTPAANSHALIRRDPRDSRMVDDESRHLVRDMPFLLDRKLHIRPDIQIPEGLLEGLERIFRIYQFQGEAMLKHHCNKYGEEAIFRVGIRSLLLSRSDTLFECPQAHPLRLPFESRLLLLQTYERHVDLNFGEKQLLAHAIGVGVDTIQAFWSNMTSRRESYFAMRTVIAARELQKQRRYEEFQSQQRRDDDELIQEQLRRSVRLELQRGEKHVAQHASMGISPVSSASEAAGRAAAQRRKTARQRGMPVEDADDNKAEQRYESEEPTE